jgi:hypothetical protein
MKELCFVITSFLCLSSCQRALEQQPKFTTYDHVRNPVSDTFPFVEKKNKRTVVIKKDFAFYKHGQKNYEIFCSVCHGVLGDGEGIVTKRGLEGPANFQTPIMRSSSDEHFFEVITNGKGRMLRMSDRISEYDRHAIIAYIRALQLSQNATVDQLNSEEKELLEKKR